MTAAQPGKAWNADRDQEPPTHTYLWQGQGIPLKVCYQVWPAEAGAATGEPEPASPEADGLEAGGFEAGGPEPADPAWLLLPALSTISSRQEWRPLIQALRQQQNAGSATLISVDWPGFGDSERRRLPYSAALLARFLADFRRDCCPEDCAVAAAGHAAGIALLAAAKHSLGFREWLLVAPTWRGPLPTMAGRPSRWYGLIRSLVELPLIGPLLYRLNTSRGLLDLMSRRHVDVAGPGLSPAGLAARQRHSRQRGARYASAAFVTGGLDPFATPEEWLAVAQALQAPLTVVVADAAPASSLAAMQALALQADTVHHLPGRLGAHQECGAQLAAWMERR